MLVNTNKTILVVVPYYERSDSCIVKNNFPRLIDSVLSQTYTNWKIVFSPDYGSYSTHDFIHRECNKIDDSRIINGLIQAYTSRVYALQNIISTIGSYTLNVHPQYKDDFVVAIIDGDDYLVNDKTFELVMDRYNNNNAGVVWTDMESDDPEFKSPCGPISWNEDVYKTPWRSSHLKTFLHSVYIEVNRSNFVFRTGIENRPVDYFRRCYDQALMLPVITSAQRQEYSCDFVDEICYHYSHKASATPSYEHTNGALEAVTANYIRNKGYLE